MNGSRPIPPWLPALGCMSILAAVSLTCLMPLLLVNVMQSALERLHLTPTAAVLVVFGIFVGLLSIGGTGTFDGIVLSGVLAALLA
ncbi:MAG TPA: DUF1614 domain-containing protein [Pirellulales bacterium]|nr:DUF1614 domain-containing protein [Pirellulales bacterium]